MRLVVTGAEGFLGRRLARELLRRGTLHIDGVDIEITELVACDLTAPGLPHDSRVHELAGDVADTGFAGRAVGGGTGAVVHLAGVVSGAAERNFDLGMRTNLDGTRALLEACRALEASPRFVFASSVAVYGGALPPQVSEATAPTPQTSYGTQKTIGELLVADYSRKGYVDGRALRLPTIAIRGDAPNAAVTSFASDIVRDPVRGTETVCPVGPGTKVWVLSPRRAVDAFIRALELGAEAWTGGRIVALPGSAVTAGELVDAVRQLAGDEVADRVRWSVDPFIDDIVSGFPITFDTSYAHQLGFQADGSAADIVRGFLEEEAAASDR